MAKPRDNSARKAQRRKKQKALRYQNELQRRKEQREKNAQSHYAKPTDAVTDFINQGIELTKWANFIDTLVDKQIEEMTLRQKTDTVKYAHMPIATWAKIKEKTRDLSESSSYLLELAGNMSNTKDLGDQIKLMGSGLSRMPSASTTYKELLARIETARKQYEEYLANPEAVNPEELDIPDEAFAVQEDEDIKTIKEMADTVSTLADEVKSQEEVLETINSSVSATTEVTPETATPSESSGDSGSDLNRFLNGQ